jgi:esterase/lipase superfamily enzyme
MTESLELAPPPAKIYRVAKYEDAWTRRAPSRGDQPPACRYDDPLGIYRTIYAASTRYEAFLVALAELRPGPNVDLSRIIDNNDPELPSIPRGQRPGSGQIVNWISKRYIGEGTPTGNFADLTTLRSTMFLRGRLADRFESYGVTEFDPVSLTYAPREITMEISRCISEIELRGGDRIDGLSYRSRLGNGIRRWALFAKEAEPLYALEAKSSARIDIDDPDLLRALDDCGLLSDPRSPAKKFWTGPVDLPSASPAPPPERSAGAAVVEEHGANYIRHDVFFATNRNEVGTGEFGVERSERLHLGRCAVSVPRGHHVGTVERPWKFAVWQFREDPEKHIVIQERALLGEDDFYAAVQKQDESSAFVFVHGFNVLFDDAVRRAAQMKHDLQFGGAAIVYSWPSAGRLEAVSYLKDEGAVEWSQAHLEAFLVDLAAKTHLQSIHIIAHSMGNRAVANALKNLSLQSAPPTFRNVVLAAPDIDKGIFLQLAAAISSRAESVTLYASSRDRALQVSHKMHDYPRAGDCTGIVVVPEVTTIDVSALDTDMLGHGYVSSSRSILADLYSLLTGHAPPRFGFERVVLDELRHYWRFVPGA